MENASAARARSNLLCFAISLGAGFPRKKGKKKKRVKTYANERKFILTPIFLVVFLLFVFMKTKPGVSDGSLAFLELIIFF